MALLKIDQFQKRILIIATVLALLVGVWFMQSYLMMILFSGVVVVLFNPVYHRFLKKGRKPSQAAFFTFIVSVLSVILPLIFVSIVSIAQIESLVNTISNGSYSYNLTDLGNSIINYINNILSSFGISYQLSIDKIAQSMSTAAQNFGENLLNGLLSSVSGFFSFFTTAIIYIYVFMSMIIYQDKIIDTVKKLNPLGNKISNLYIQRIEAMMKATVRGQFIIAFCQGTASAVVLALVGLSDLFFFFWMLLTVLSIVPLGAGIVTIPIGIIMILLGNVWQGAVVILSHLLIVTNIDNVLRPRLVPAEARLNSALMILAVFAGIGMFGFFGIVLGPVLMIILVTTVQIYLEVFTKTESLQYATDKESGLLDKMKIWNKS